MAARQLTSALLLALALSATHSASANFIGYIAPCANVNSLKCTGVSGTFKLTSVTSCNQVTVGCYGTDGAMGTCGLFKDSASCPSCTDNGDSVTLKCTAGSSCTNPREQTELFSLHKFHPLSFLERFWRHCFRRKFLVG